MHLELACSPTSAAFVFVPVSNECHKHENGTDIMIIQEYNIIGPLYIYSPTSLLAARCFYCLSPTLVSYHSCTIGPTHWLLVTPLLAPINNWS